MNKYHFVGIKGAGMSALAQVLHGMGHDVKGSDIDKVFFTQTALMSKGIEIQQFNENNIKADENVIISRAFDTGNPEVKKAFEMNNGKFYFDFLGEFINGFKTSIAVSGSHGKTTTTGLMSHVLSSFEPTSYLIGDGTGKGEPNSQSFVFEACEYKNHFLSYSPDFAIITNIDFDHPDFFKSKEDVVNSFQQFAQNVKRGLIVCGEQEDTRNIKASVPVWKYGFSEDHDIYAKNVMFSPKGTSFDVYIKGENIATATIPFYGEHHILNSLAVLSVMHLNGHSVEEAVRKLQSFEGVKRRFNETVVDTNIVIDDYAHHPTEIKATLQSIRLKYPNKKAIVLFQPHTYSRTKALFNEFVDSLEGYDGIYLADIFGSAREKTDDIGISSQRIVESIKNDNAKKINGSLPHEFFSYENAVLAFLGAGDVNKYKDEYLNKTM